MRQVVAMFGAVAVGVGLVVLAAGPVHASTNLGTVTWNGTTLSGNNLSGAVNDTYTFTNTGGSTVYLVNDSGTASVGGSSCASTGIATSLCSVANAAPVTVTVTSLGAVRVWEGFLTKGDITVIAGSSNSSGGNSSPISIPAPIVQQFAKPVAGTCDAAQPSGLDWSGVTSGGWSESWAEWANAGQGGKVCTRMLEYSSALGRWVIG